MGDGCGKQTPIVWAGKQVDCGEREVLCDSCEAEYELNQERDAERFRLIEDAIQRGEASLWVQPGVPVDSVRAFADALRGGG